MDDANDRVTAAEIIRNFGYWQQQALARPLTVTHHGRARTMLISTEAYESLASVSANSGASAGGQMDALCAHMAEGLIIIDRDFIVRDVNDTALTWMNATREQLVGAPLAAPDGGAINPLHLSMLKRVMRTGESLTYDFVAGMRPGSTLHVRSFPHGDMVGSIYTDVTEFVSLNVAQHIREAALTGLDRLGAVGIAELDSAAAILSASAVFARLVGEPPERLTGRVFPDLCAEPDRMVVLRSIAAASRTNEAQDLTVAILAADGPARTFRLGISGMENAGPRQGVTIALAPTVNSAGSHS